MDAESKLSIREEMYDEYNMPSNGRTFVKYFLPVLERYVQPEDNIRTDRRDEVLAEIALWKAFDSEPKNMPFIILSAILLSYDYLYSMPVGIYGVSIVGLATVGGLITSVRGRKLLAAEYAGETDGDGIPAGLRLNAMNVASTTVTLVYVTLGIIVQMIGSSGLVGNEFLSSNIMSNGPIPYWVTIIGILIGLFLLGEIRS